MNLIREQIDEKRTLTIEFKQNGDYLNVLIGTGIATKQERIDLINNIYKSIKNSFK